MKIDLNNKQKQILWAILNNAQAQGINIVAVALRSFQGKDEKFIKDWIKQTQEEYDFINELKAKLEGE